MSIFIPTLIFLKQLHFCVDTEVKFRAHLGGSNSIFAEFKNVRWTNHCAPCSLNERLIFPRLNLFFRSSCRFGLCRRSHCDSCRCAEKKENELKFSQFVRRKNRKKRIFFQYDLGHGTRYFGFSTFDLFLNIWPGKIIKTLGFREKKWNFVDNKKKK